MHVIFFDAVGTLFGVRGSVGEIYAEVATKHGVSVDAFELDRAFYQAFGSAPPAAFPGADASQLPQLERAWWQDLVVQTFAALPGVPPFPNFAAYFAQVYDLFATASAWQIYAETVSVLETLSARGIRLGVISNFDSRLHPVLHVLGLKDFFSTVTLSTQVGAAKPDALVFETALRQQQVPGKRALHVGDSHSQDYLGAKQAGLQALWLNRASEPGPERIQDLEGILPWLDLKLDP